MSIKINKSIMSLFGIQYSGRKPKVTSTRKGNMTTKELMTRMRSQVASLDKAILNGMDGLMVAEP
jgi:hypothetical protein